MAAMAATAAPTTAASAVNPIARIADRTAAHSLSAAPALDAIPRSTVGIAISSMADRTLRTAQTSTICGERLLV